MEKILPSDTQKLISRSPFPLKRVGTIYEYILVVRAMVNPKARPYSKRATSICVYVVTRGKRMQVMRN